MSFDLRVNPAQRLLDNKLLVLLVVVAQVGRKIKKEECGNCKRKRRLGRQGDDRR
jgi:hypothetical protein